MQKRLMLKHYIPYLISDYVQKFNIVRPLTYPEFLSEMMERGDIHIVIKDTHEVISARVFTGNESSHKLLKKLGFVQEGFLKHAACDYYDVIHDLSLYVKFRKPTSV
ncbi:MAG: GNAT family N-acetyltransferase [Erysipelothrix sp.]|nr:GNAT family N-acetyltransferase [Erysipelothrix sp.]